MNPRSPWLERDRLWTWLWLAGSVWGAGALADPAPVNLDQRYPRGTINTEALAEQAVADAAAARQALNARYKAESTRCLRVFLTNECEDEARRAHMLGESQAQRVEAEAHDLQRKRAADQRAAQREAQRVQQQQQEAARPEREREAQQAAQQRTDRAQEHAQDVLRQQEQAPTNREHYEQRNTQHDQDEVQRASVQLRKVAENERRYQEKQEQAKAYAASRAKEREENQKARDERERKRKAQMTQEKTDTAVEPQK